MDLLSKPGTRPSTVPPHDAARESLIAEMAYKKWEKSSKRPDDLEQFWLEAEKELDEQEARRATRG